jgi:hypothetical protein
MAGGSRLPPGNLCWMHRCLYSQRDLNGAIKDENNLGKRTSVHPETLDGHSERFERVIRGKGILNRSSLENNGTTGLRTR